MPARIQQKRKLNKTFHLYEPFKVNTRRHNCASLFIRRWFGCHTPTVTLGIESRTTRALLGNNHGGTMRFALAVTALALAILAGAGTVAAAATPQTTTVSATPDAGTPYN
jgi:hypothetical protein